MAPSSKGDNVAFDPHKLLAELKGIVQDNKKPGKGGGKSWLGTLAIIVAILAGVAVWSWISWRRGRELAKLRHEKNKTKILAEKAAFDAEIHMAGKEQIRLGALLDTAKNRMRTIEADIRAEEARYEADMRAIDSIRSWRAAGVR